MPRRYSVIGGSHDFTDSSREAIIGKRIKPRADGCWIFDGKPDEYGTVSAGLTGTNELAHRWVYRTLVGEIPDGYHIHHHCFNRGCVNPAHLTPMTPGDHSKHHHDLRAADKAA